MIAVKFIECKDEKTAQHILSKKLLSQMLKENLGVKDYVPKTQKNGKPYLENAVFSISHSKNIVGCAVVSEKSKDADMVFKDNPSEIGLDIEVYVKDDERYRKIAKRYFSEMENSHLQTATDYSLEFLKLWTKKEAFVKCTGEGLKAIRKPLPQGIITEVIKLYNETVIISICKN